MKYIAIKIILTLCCTVGLLISATKVTSAQIITVTCTEQVKNCFCSVAGSCSSDGAICGSGTPTCSCNTGGICSGSGVCGGVYQPKGFCSCSSGTGTCSCTIINSTYQNACRCSHGAYACTKVSCTNADGSVNTVYCGGGGGCTPGTWGACTGPCGAFAGTQSSTDSCGKTTTQS